MTRIAPFLTVFSAFLGLFLLFFPINGSSAELPARVVGITDGDTVRVRINTDEGFREEKVRLDQIDAPERGQPFGEKSRQYLASLVHGRDITLRTDGRDRYGRLIGDLLLDGKSMNAEMVRAGYAWVYRRYMKDENLLLLEGAARNANRGLWSEPAPIPPWDWRRGKRTAERASSSVNAHSECLDAPRCGDLPDCEAAQFQLRQCGANRLDGDNDGIPCEALCSNQGN
ncbi:MAG: thermonuclease family protein [Gammaproteobacteria bacterium]|nr:thermonuclease family protein [Gammaproteobacteria bacterium]